MPVWAMPRMCGVGDPGASRLCHSGVHIVILVVGSQRWIAPRQGGKPLWRDSPRPAEAAVFPMLHDMHLALKFNITAVVNIAAARQAAHGIRPPESKGELLSRTRLRRVNSVSTDTFWGGFGRFQVRQAQAHWPIRVKTISLVKGAVRDGSSRRRAGYVVPMQCGTLQKTVA